MKKINLTEYITKSGSKLSLTREEKERMKHVLTEYMRMKPLRNIPLDRKAPVQHFFLSIYAFSRRSVAALLVFGLLVSGAGASYAAESSLPGDILYSLKTSVNEPVVAALSVSSEAKTEWNIERAERRLEETAQLASQNKLSVETEVELAEKFETYASAAAEGIQKLEEEESPAVLSIASRFETKLESHEVVLANTRTEKDITSVRDRIRAKAELIAQVRLRAEGETSGSATVAIALSSEPPIAMRATADSSADLMSMEAAPEENVHAKSSNESKTKIGKNTVERTQKAAEKEFESAGKLLKKVRSKLDEETSGRVLAGLSVIEGDLQNGEAFLEEENYAEAYRAFSAALEASEELNVFLKAFNKSRITSIPDIRGTLRESFERDLEVEILVPEDPFQGDGPAEEGGDVWGEQLR